MVVVVVVEDGERRRGRRSRRTGGRNRAETRDRVFAVIRGHSVGPVGLRSRKLRKLARMWGGGAVDPP